MGLYLLFICFFLSLLPKGIFAHYIIFLKYCITKIDFLYFFHNSFLLFFYFNGFLSLVMYEGKAYYFFREESFYLSLFIFDKIKADPCNLAFFIFRIISHIDAAFCNHAGFCYKFRAVRFPVKVKLYTLRTILFQFSAQGLLRFLTAFRT